MWIEGRDQGVAGNSHRARRWIENSEIAAASRVELKFAEASRDSGIQSFDRIGGGVEIETLYPGADLRGSRRGSYRISIDVGVVGLDELSHRFPNPFPILCRELQSVFFL